MPPKARRNETAKRSAKLDCQHISIRVEPSFHASEVGYFQPTAANRAKAQGTNLKHFKDNPLTFPAPLILPDDDLALYPDESPQSLSSWTREKHRNAVTSKRRTVYICPPPSFDSEVKFARSWATPISTSVPSQPAIPYPNIEDLAAYIRAFYYPLPVKIFPSPAFKFAPWSATNQKALKSDKESATPALIGLHTPTEAIGIRTRPASQHDFSRQLNLDDLLDAAIASLPEDAYALLMLVNQDLYEDDDDAFVCGRAYGGSRVAVVSTARYNPALDAGLELDLEHVWPLSHCSDFMNGFRSKKTKKSAQDMGKDEDSPAPTPDHGPLHAAVEATLTFRSSNQSQESPTSLWLSRLARTTAHELGHCFGMDHCTYYACCMQGSSSLHEDHRQPPYLCPVDLAKVLKATGTSEEEHLRAMLGFCEGVGKDASMFVAMAAWIRRRLKELGVENSG